MLTKWLLKNGFGAPGHTAKTYCERFNHYYYQCSGDITQIMQAVYFERVLTANKLHNTQACFDVIPPEEIIKLADKDFPSFIFMVSFLETANFRNGVATQDKLLATTVEIIYETVQKMCPKGIAKPLHEFFSNASAFSRKTYFTIHTILKK